MDMIQEMPLNFKTAVPVPFKDAKTGASVYVECSVTATVVPTNTDKYPDRMAVNRIGQTDAMLILNEVISNLSGKADATNLMANKNEIIKNLKDGLKNEGLDATSIEILSIGPDEMSMERLKRAEAAGGIIYDNVTLDAKVLADVDEMARKLKEAAAIGAATRMGTGGLPAFCIYCGGKAGSKFCPNCGAKLVD